MLDRNNFSRCIGDSLSRANVGILWEILHSFLCISYGGGIRTLSRYTTYSERSLFRFIRQTINWNALFVRIFKYFIHKEGCIYLLVADETVESKSRKSTFGQGRFYSSVLQTAINSVCFFGFSLVEVDSEKSYFLGLNQVVHNEQDKVRIAAEKAKRAAGKGKPKGRKKGTKNAPKKNDVAADAPEQTASFRTFKTFFESIMSLLSSLLPGLNLSYLILDSAYGNSKYLQLAKEKGLCVISKLRQSPALFFLPDTPQNDTDTPNKKRGRPQKYGRKVDIKNLPDTLIVSEKTENGIHYTIYQFQAYNKEMPAFLLNVVSTKATNLKTGKVAYRHLFSNDLQLDAQTMIAYYTLRFQIEFDFRDAKQHFGLHKFKNYHQTQLNNMFNLAFLALVAAKVWQQQWAIKLKQPKLSLLDLKTIIKAQKNLESILKLHKNDLNVFLNPDFVANFVPNDLINAA